MMPDVNQDAAFVRSAAQELEDYLLSASLFWQLSGQKGAPLRGDSDQLTPGNLLLNLARLEGWQQAGAAVDESTLTAMAAIQQTRECWKSAWWKKSAQDWEHRLGLWRHYLAEWKAEAAAQLPAEYGYHIRQRVILDLLIADGGVHPLESASRLQPLDGALRRKVGKGKFVWHEALQVRFPLPEYWYLYAVN